MKLYYCYCCFCYYYNKVPSLETSFKATWSLWVLWGIRKVPNLPSPNSFPVIPVQSWMNEPASKSSTKSETLSGEHKIITLITQWYWFQKSSLLLFHISSPCHLDVQPAGFAETTNLVMWHSELFISKRIVSRVKHLFIILHWVPNSKGRNLAHTQLYFLFFIHNKTPLFLTCWTLDSTSKTFLLFPALLGCVVVFSHVSALLVFVLYSLFLADWS